MTLFWQEITASIILSGIFALLAVSMTIIYSVSHIVQFAQGDVMIFGGYVGYLSAKAAPNIAIALIAAAVITGLTGLILNEVIFRWLPAAGHLPLVAAIALSTAMSEGMRLTFNQGQAVVYPASVHASRFASGGSLQYVVFAIALGLGVAVHLLLRRTRFGRAVRATAENREMAAVLGVPVNNMVRLTFILGSAMAGAAGVLFALVNGFLSPYLGQSQVFIAVTAMLLGGLGSVTGAVVGSVVVSFTQVFVGTYLSSSWQQMFTFGLIVLILLVRPNGLFGYVRGVRA
jgi:branched-chain amino acid transport system permease protein